MGRVSLISPDGKRTESVDESEVGHRLALGWHQEEQEAATARAVHAGRLSTVSGVGNAISTGLREGLGAATFGVTTAVQAALGNDDTREAMALSREAHPTATTVGRVGGTIAQAFVIPGGPALGAGKLGAAEVALHAGKTALVGAGIGAADTTGQYISDSLIYDHDITVEGALAAAEPGALWGAAGGGAFGAAEGTVAGVRRLYGGGTRAKVADALVDGASRREAGAAGRGFADEPLDLGINIPDVPTAPGVTLPESLPGRSQQGFARGIADDPLALPEGIAPITDADVAAAGAKPAPAVKRGRRKEVKIGDMVEPGLTREAAVDASHAAAREVGAQLDDTARLLEQAELRLDAGVQPHLADPAKAELLQRAAGDAPPIVDQPAAAGTPDGARKPRRPRKGKSDVPIAQQEADLMGQLQASVTASPDDIAIARAKRVKRAAADADPELAKLQAAKDELEAARGELAQALGQGPAVRAFDRRAAVEDTVDAWMRRANEGVAREDDVVRSTGGHGDVLRAKLGRSGRVGDERFAQSRMRDPFTDEEIIAQSVADPTFYDRGSQSIEGKIGAGPASIRTEDLAGYLLKRPRRVADVEIETLGNRVHPETGEVLSGVDAYRRPATADEILATARQGDDADDIIEGALRRHLGLEPMGHIDEAVLIPKLARVEQAEHDMVTLLGDNLAPPGSVRRSAEYAAAADTAAETRAMAAAQRGEAITDAARVPLAQRMAGQYGIREPRPTPAFLQPMDEAAARAWQSGQPTSWEAAGADAPEGFARPPAPGGGSRTSPGKRSSGVGEAVPEPIASDPTIYPTAPVDDPFVRPGVPDQPMAPDAMFRGTGNPGGPPPAAGADVTSSGLPYARDRQPPAGPAGARQAVPGAAAGGRGAALDAAAALEVLASLDVPGLPSAKSIPVIGGVLSMYLKARAGVRAFQRFGGKIPQTVESSVASSAGAARRRLREIVGKSLGPAEAGARAARRAAPGTLAILATPLFRDDGDPPAARRSGNKAAEAYELWQQRALELDAASRPGAIARAVRAAVPTSNPRLAAAMANAVERKLTYLRIQMPRAPAGFALGTKLAPWRPSDAAMADFARLVRAVEQPLQVIEEGLQGDITVDQVEAIRTVYPRMYAEAQQHLIELSMTRTDVPHARRAWLSNLWDVPMDPSQSPAFIGSMQQVYEAQAAPPPTAGPMPGLAAPIDLGAGMMLPEAHQ